MWNLKYFENLFSQILNEIKEQFNPYQVKQEKSSFFYVEFIRNMTMVILFIFAWTAYHEVKFNFIMIMLGLFVVWKIYGDVNITWGKWVFLITLISFISSMVFNLNFQPFYFFTYKLLTTLIGIIFMFICINFIVDKFGLKKR